MTHDSLSNFSRILTDRRGRPSPAVAMTLVLMYAAMLALSATSGFPADLGDGRALPYLSDKPLGEDGFYLLTVAWNWAETGRFEYNYRRITTGVQPLAVFIFGGLARAVQAAGGDKWLFALGMGAISEVFPIRCFGGGLIGKYKAAYNGQINDHSANAWTSTIHDYSLQTARTIKLFNLGLFNFNFCDWRRSLPWSSRKIFEKDLDRVFIGIVAYKSSINILHNKGDSSYRNRP